MISCVRALCIGVLLASFAPLKAQAAKRPKLTLDLLIRVASCKGKPVKPRSWVKAHVDAANKIFGAHAIEIQARTEAFKPRKCELTTRADRDGLAPHATPGKVVVLVVRRAQDVDLRSYNLMGVHWRYGGESPELKGRRWIILTARARPPVLAHELCHYLGLRHDRKGGNLMTPGPSDPIWRREGRKPKKWKPLLTRKQARRVRAAVAKIAGKPD
jgi:hypothetical protein